MSDFLTIHVRAHPEPGPAKATGATTTTTTGSRPSKGTDPPRTLLVHRVGEFFGCVEVVDGAVLGERICTTGGDLAAEDLASWARGQRTASGRRLVAGSPEQFALSLFLNGNRYRRPVAAWDWPPTFGALAVDVSGSADGNRFSLALPGFGAPSRVDPEQWSDSFRRARVHIASRGPGSAGARIWWGGIVDAGSRAKSKRPASWIDLRTLAAAIANGDFRTAAQAAEFFGVPWPTGIDDPRERLRAELAALVVLHGVLVAALAELAPGLDPSRAWSCGTIAGSVLGASGVRPLWDRAEAVTGAQRGAMGASFHSGRTEAALVGLALPCDLVDIDSQYPSTVSALGLTASPGCARITSVDCTDEVRALLSRPGLLDACYDLEAWRAFALTFARIRPRGDVLPATVEWRPGFIGATVAPLDMAGASLPFHLCDLVASVLATGQAPEIVEAWRLVPEGVADGLRPIRLPGGVRLDLTREGADLGAALKEAKARAKVDPRHWLGAASKGIAVAMSFGNLARVDPDSDAIILGPDGERLVCGGNGEKPGPLGFLPMAAAVTAGGRLLIAMAKRAIEDLGGSVAAIHTDSVLVPADDVAHLVACPGGPHRLDDGTDAVRCLSHEQVRAITDRFSAIGVTWKAENGTGEGTTWGMCLGANKVLLGRFDESGTFRIVRSSDTSLGAHLLDPTGTGALTEDGRSGWAADLEELLLAANIGGDPNGSLVVPELPPWAGLPVVRHDRASTPRTLELLRERVGDATLPPFTPYLTVKEAVAVVSGDVPGPDRWLGLDWRRGHGARSGLVVRGPDGWGVGAPGIVSVACSPVADLFGEWTHGTNLSTEGPRRGLRSVVPVVSDGAHVVVVGKAGEVLYLDEREPLEDAPAQRAFGSGGVEELRHRVRVAGVGAVADGAGMSRRCIGKWLAGGGTDRLPAIAGAVADLECSTPTETPMPVACERVGCDQPARPRSRTCSNACKVALRRGRPVAPLIDNVSPVAPPVAPPIGNVPWPTEPGVWVGSELPEYIDGVRWSIALAVAKPADCDPWGSDNPADPDAEDLEPEEWWARFSAGRSR